MRGDPMSGWAKRASRVLAKRFERGATATLSHWHRETIDPNGSTTI